MDERQSTRDSKLQGVTEALGKDVGRAFARMDPEDLQRLQVAIGDIVEMAGKRTTVCKAMPAYKEQRGQSRIQIDGLTPGERRRRARRIRAGAQDGRAGRPSGSCSRRTTITPDGPRPEVHRQPAGRPAGGRRRPRPGHAVRQPLRPISRSKAPTPKGPVLINPTTLLMIGKAAGEGAGARIALLRGHRRPEAAAAAHPRDDRAAAALPGGVRAAGHRRAQGRAAATGRPAAARR